MSGRCLHCGAQLAVLRKLTGGGDFCSEAHRSTYQDELNKIALSRLKKARPRQEQSAGMTEGGSGFQIAEAVKAPEMAAPAPATFLPLPPVERIPAPTQSISKEEPLASAETVLYPDRQARSLAVPVAGLLASATMPPELRYAGSGSPGIPISNPGLLMTHEFVEFNLRRTLPASGATTLAPRVPRAPALRRCQTFETRLPDGRGSVASLDPSNLLPSPDRQEGVASRISIETLKHRPAMRDESAPVPHPDRDLDLSGLLETRLFTTGFDLSGEESSQEESSQKVEPALPLAALASAVAEATAAPPQATELRKITVVAISPARPVVVHSFQPIPPAFPCRKPEVKLLPFRSAPAVPAAAAAVSSAVAAVNAPSAPAISPAPDAQARATPATRPAPAPAEAPKAIVAREYAATNFTLGMPNHDMGSPISRFWNVIPSKARIAIVACLLVAIVAYVVSKGTGKPTDGLASGLAATAPVSGFVGGNIPAGGGGWVTEWAGDPLGSKRGKQLTLYKPSMQLKDYRTEFVGQIDTTSLGWVFRVKDNTNYYAMKVRVVRPGVEPQIALTRYAVVNGVEGPRVDIPLDFSVRNDTLYKIQLEVRGPKFTTSIQGRAVDIWSDDRLNSGGFGFSNERGERAHINSVGVRNACSSLQSGAMRLNSGR